MPEDIPSIAKAFSQSVTQITEHFGEIRERVSRAARGRGDEVMIVAVSKTQAPEAIRAAHAAGCHHFGENYLQEALPKIAALAHLDLEWHFIGAVQANKTRAIAERFQWVHTVDRERVAARLDASRPFFASPLNVLIQVNLAGEPQKAGVAEQEVVPLAAAIAALPRLALRGLTCMPPAAAGSAERRALFLRTAALAADLRARGLRTDVLSMGMSEDFELAIECGATCVRLGTAIFGPRTAER